MKILVVDDEKLLVKGIKFNLENEGYQVLTAYDGTSAVELARQEIVTLKKEADAFKKNLLDMYSKHIKLLSKIPEYAPESVQPADAQPEPAAAPAAQPAAEPAYQTPVYQPPVYQPAPPVQEPVYQPAEPVYQPEPPYQEPGYQ